MTELSDPIAAIRRFNRFYTRAIGVLDQGHLGMPLSLAESRVVYEIAQRGHATPKAVAEATGLDPGYLSRILKRFERQGLIARERSDLDGRSVTLSLTAAGRDQFAKLEARTVEKVEGLIGALDEGERETLTEAMAKVQRLLTEPEPGYTLRPHRIGDIGWVIHRHAVLYAKERGWNARFEAEVAHIAGHFLEHFDPARERCWIAERDGEIVGSIFLEMDREEQAAGRIAKLRLLLVEPSARGLGLGRRLVAECVGFARQAGYEAITLWTQSELTSARKIYAAEGFELIETWPNDDFGAPLTSETWKLVL